MRFIGFIFIILYYLLCGQLANPETPDEEKCYFVGTIVGIVGTLIALLLNAGGLC